MNKASSFIGKVKLVICAAIAVVAMGSMAARAADAPPLKALFLTGGGYHDYKKLAPYLTTNLSQKINIKFDTAFTMDGLKDEKFADGYDVVVYDVCFDNMETNLLQTAMKVAKAGKPTVMIH